MLDYKQLGTPMDANVKLVTVQGELYKIQRDINHL